MEIWKPVKDYDNYEISNLGNLRKFKNGNYKLLKPIKGIHYYNFGIYLNGIQKRFTAHQLVAIAFLNHLPSKYNLVINHKNFDKLDNRVENLEIVTARENSNKKHLKSSSKYIGVSWYKKRNKWISTIFINGKLKNLGYFINEEDASIKYEQELLKIKKKKL